MKERKLYESNLVKVIGLALLLGLCIVFGLLFQSKSLFVVKAGLIDQKGLIVKTKGVQLIAGDLPYCMLGDVWNYNSQTLEENVSIDISESYGALVEISKGQLVSIPATWTDRAGTLLNPNTLWVVSPELNNPEYDAGFEDGYTNGYNIGHSEGYNQGLNEGYDNGFNFGVGLGGRNLLLNSDKQVSNSNFLMTTYNLSEEIPEGTKVTLSIKGILNPNVGWFEVFNSGDSVWMGAVLRHADKNADGVYVKTFNWRVSTSSNTFINVYVNTTDGLYVSEIEWIKLELGSVATPYSRAPEDINQDYYDNGFVDGDSAGYIRGYTNGSNDGYTEGYDNGYMVGITEDAGQLGFWELVPMTVSNVWSNTVMPIFNYDFFGVKILDIWVGLVAIAIAIFIAKWWK